MILSEVFVVYIVHVICAVAAQCRPGQKKLMIYGRISPPQRYPMFVLLKGNCKIIIVLHNIKLQFI